ncbi:MAG TPA: phosphoribosylanthranilate isomerase [Elusimicrobiota bacterium]|nr:phosphoribosylanthranilate isomerase [Elusimicrobiota bacterium]
MPAKVKICGITNTEDATWTVNLGAEYIGLNFWPESPRKVSLGKAVEIVQKLPPFVVTVGVFVNQPVDEIVKTVLKTGIKGVQLSGEETPEYCRQLAEALRDKNPFLIKVFHVSTEADLEPMTAYKDMCQYFLLDARVENVPGGTGQTFPWDLVQRAKTIGIPLFIAGGLTPDNVKEAIKKTEPYAVDVASGVEKSPKRKDYEKMKLFIEQSKAVR